MTGETINLLLQLTQGLIVEGMETSFKMAERKLLANRFLLGITNNQSQSEEIIHICQQINMPPAHLEAFKENLSDANIVGIGFEESQSGCVYKVYLEFWDKIKNEIRTKQNKTAPLLMFLGFKWDPQDNNKAALAHYICYPLLSVANILKKVSNMYAAASDRVAGEIARGIVMHAAGRIDTSRDSFIYLEVGEEHQPHRSFDINLYKANLQLKELYPLLSRICRHYSIPSEEFDRIYEPLSTNICGHLSGGIDRQDKDFLSIYCEL